MLDLLRITIPFRPSAVVTSRPVSSVAEAAHFGVYGHIRDMLKYTSDGMRVSAFSVAYDEEGNVSVSELKHPFESLPSSFSGIAVKIYDGFMGASAPVWPHVSMKASPAKVMQGHNIYGGSCLLQASIEFIMTLREVRPSLYKDLSIADSQATNIDVTFSCRFLPVGSPIAHQTGRDLIKLMRNVSSGQLKPCEKRLHETTIYYGSPETQLSSLKGYLKYDEVLTDLRDAKRKKDELSRRLVSVLSSQELQDFAQNLLRLEASFFRDYLRRHDIPLNLFDLIQYQQDLLKQGRCFLRELWLNKTAPLFKAFEGHTMKVLNDDDVLKKIMTVHGRPVKSRSTKQTTVEKILDDHGMYDHALSSPEQAVKISYSYANTLFSFYRDLKEHGYKSVYSNYKSSQSSLRKFQRYIADLVEAGLSKAYLQSFELNDEPTNVIPLVRLLELNFTDQFPEGYVPPVSRFANSPDLPSIFHRFINQQAAA